MENIEEKYSKYLSQIEKNEKKSFLKLIGITIFGILLAVTFIFITINAIKTKNSTINEKNNEIIIRDSVYNELKEDVLLTYEKLDSNQLDSSTIKRIQQSKHNLNTLPNIAFQGGPTIVRYYKRNNDDPSISKVIEQLGFYLNIRPVKDDNNISKVNTIWYGDSVNLKEIQLLTKYLINTNNDFKLIRKFQKHEDYKWKNKAIEIGYSTENDSLSELTLKDLDAILTYQKED